MKAPDITEEQKAQIDETIINHLELLDIRNTEFNALKQDIEHTQNENLSIQIGNLFNEHENPLKKYVYFTLPYTAVKFELYKLVFNQNIKSKLLSSKQRGKINPLFEGSLQRLNIIPVFETGIILKKLGLNSIVKTELHSPLFGQIIQSIASRDIDDDRLAFNSIINGETIYNKSSINPDHPRVFNIFTSMTSSVREHVFNTIYKTNMAEIDFNNSIYQCIASKGKCAQILSSIKNNTFLPSSPIKRKRVKSELMKLTFSLLSNKLHNAEKFKRETELRERLIKQFGEEGNQFVDSLKNMQSVHELFHFEDILRDFCRNNPESINVHDAVYIPSDRTDLINSLTQLLDQSNYYYKVKNKHVP